MKREDYTLRGWLVCLTTVVGVICLGLIPPFEVFGLRTERVDALSLLRPKRATIDNSYAEIEVIDNALARANLDSMLMATPEVKTKPATENETLKWSVSTIEKQSMNKSLRSDDIDIDHDNIIAIENFDTLADNRFNNFIEKLAMGEDVRIAVMGDSFVEGDIVTSDLRDMLQRTYGGRGVGFVPCDIPFTTVRTTVKREATGWTSYSIMKHKSVPESLNDKFFASGYISEGGAGATVTWRTVDKYPTLDSCTRANILLMARDSSKVALTITNSSDTLKREMTIAASDKLQHIDIEAPINSITLKVMSGNVVCYGASLDGGGGVIVDNFSVRSNNGHAIYNMNKSICNDANDIFNYDLVVLQYGLNIMQPGQSNYTKYKEQLCTMIDYAKAYFPNAAIMVLGVSDRWIMDAETEEYIPIGSVDAMTSYQRDAAEECGVSFWNTSEAMTALGGMPAFVANGWAAGDYTHINFAGGRRIANALTNALNHEVYSLLCENELLEQRAREARREHERAIQERNAQIMEQRETIINGIIDIDTLGIVMLDDADTTNDSSMVATELDSPDMATSEDVAEHDVDDTIEMEEDTLSTKSIDNSDAATFEGDVTDDGSNELEHISTDIGA